MGKFMHDNVIDAFSRGMNKLGVQDNGFVVEEATPTLPHLSNDERRHLFIIKLYLHQFISLAEHSLNLIFVPLVQEFLYVPSVLYALARGNHQEPLCH